MAVVISFLLVALALTLAIPITMLLLEVLAAVLWQTDSLTMSTDEVRRRVAVLIPAHDEGTNLLPTIARTSRRKCSAMIVCSLWQTIVPMTPRP